MLQQAQEMMWAAHGSPLAAVGEAGTSQTPDAAPHAEPRAPETGAAPHAERPAPETDAGSEPRHAGDNPFNFLPPPADAMVTMAVVEWTNLETGETWTAPSGGYQPPSESWVSSGAGAPELESPDGGGRFDILPPPEGEDGTAAIRPVEPFIPWSFSVETVVLTDEAGEIVGYEIVTLGGDDQGSWTRSTQSYTADWRTLSSSYADNSGFSYTFETRWSEDGVELGHVHRYTGGGNSYVSEVNYDASWRILNAYYEDLTSGYRSFSEFWYDEAGSMIGGTSTQFWTDDNGPQSSTDQWWANEPVVLPEEYLGEESGEDPLPEVTGETDGPADGSVSEETPAEESPEPWNEGEAEFIPEIIVCPGVLEPESPPPFEIPEIPPGDSNGLSEFVPELIICILEPQWVPLEEVVWEDVVWEPESTGEEPATPDICILPPPMDEPVTFDPSWLRPAVVDFEPVPTVGVLPSDTFG